MKLITIIISFTACRYSFTVFSNIYVAVMMWVVLKCTNAHEKMLGPDEAGQFQVRSKRIQYSFFVYNILAVA